MILNGQPPPSSLECEECLLGSCLRHGEMIGDVLDLIKAEEFSRDAHQKIFAILVDRYDSRLPTDPALLAEELKSRGQLDDVGGPHFLGQLWDKGATDAIYYARVVHSKYILRSQMYVGEKIYHNAADQLGDPDALQDEAERMVLAIGQRRLLCQSLGMEDLARRFCDRIDERCRKDGKTRGVPTGFIDLDEKTTGLQKGELIIAAARPSVGKTSFALQVAAHAALNEGIPVLFVTIEQSQDELFERLACAHACVDSLRLRKGRINDHEADLITEALERLRQSPLRILDSPAISMLQIAAAARRHQLQYKTGLVVVDYLQLIEAENHKSPRHEQVGAISRRLKRLAKELEIPVLAVAQLNRASEDRADSKPRLSDLRESGEIEQNADVVLLFHRPEAGSDLVCLQVAKQRNGPIGDLSLYFRGQFMKFENFGVESPFGDER